MGDQEVKKVRELWYEYLKLNERYKDFCENVRANPGYLNTLGEEIVGYDTRGNYGKMPLSIVHQYFGDVHVCESACNNDPPFGIIGIQN